MQEKEGKNSRSIRINYECLDSNQFGQKTGKVSSYFSPNFLRLR